MNILDENVPEAQRDLLGGMRVAVRQIGIEIGRKGMGDEDIIPLLRRLGRPTFFTLDGGFYKPRLCHERYSLVYLDIERKLAAMFVRRLLKHPEFNTKVKRMGCVIRVSPNGLAVWRVNNSRESHVSWR